MVPTNEADRPGDDPARDQPSESFGYDHRRWWVEPGQQDPGRSPEQRGHEDRTQCRTGSRIIRFMASGNNPVSHAGRAQSPVAGVEHRPGRTGSSSGHPPPPTASLTSPPIDREWMYPGLGVGCEQMAGADTTKRQDMPALHTPAATHTVVSGRFRRSVFGLCDAHSWRCSLKVCRSVRAVPVAAPPVGLSWFPLATMWLGAVLGLCEVQSLGRCGLRH